MPGGRITKIKGVRCYVADCSNASITVIKTGVGIEKALKVSQGILADGPWDLAISSGFAGALISTGIGTCVLPQAVIFKPSDSNQQLGLSPFPCSVEYLQIAQRVIDAMKSPHISGTLVTVPSIVWSVSEKFALAEMFQASALDMESAGIAEKATERGIPFLVMRTVSDLKGESLPEAFNLFLSPSTWMRGTWQIISRPALWIKLYRLQQQTKVASQELTNIFETFFRFLGQQKEDLPQGIE